MSLYKNKLFRLFIWYGVSRTFVALWLKPRYHHCIVPGSDAFPPPPFILLANHGTFFDPWLVGSLTNAPVSYMCNDDAFRASPATVWYLDSIGAFPKKKGAADIKAMKETLRRLAAKEPVCIFPEGQTTWDGRTQLIYKGIEKLLKKAGCPLVMMRLCGNFLSKPWWAEFPRKGRVLVAAKVINPAEMRLLSDDALFETIREYIKHDDVRDERNKKAGFAGKNLAEGLERFVWICPSCAVEDRLTMHGDTVCCESCGGRWEMDALCRFTSQKEGTAEIGDLCDWADSHKTAVKLRIKNGRESEILTTSENVLRQQIAADGYSFDDWGRGKLTLTKSNLSFLPDSGGGDTWSVPAANIRDCVIQKKDMFEIREGGRYYRFVFDHKSPMKWIYYIRYLQGYEDCEARGYL